MRKGVVTFEDLQEGTMITGKIKNVVDFGAFVDLGLKETALVHISEMSDQFIKNPLEAVKVGDVLEFRIISLDTQRRRIGLSRKSGNTVKSTELKPVEKPKERSARETEKAAQSKPHRQTGKQPSSRPSSRKDDDGTMYNPFAEAFRKMDKK